VTVGTNDGDQSAGEFFGLTPPRGRVAEHERAMAGRRAIKAVLRP